MGPSAEKKGELFTYGDYLTWDDDERWELIDGVAYNMTPAPSRFHQQVCGDLHRQLANFFLNTSCKVYAAPFDVRLPEMEEIDESTKTIVQPDISVICDPSKLDDKGCKGAPDLVVEILSPATARKDMKEKFLRYERAGVKEYWIVDPSGKVVSVYRNSEAGFGRPSVYGVEERIKVDIFDGLEVELQSVFVE
jgi:Uma2 family endonuclease